MPTNVISPKMNRALEVVTTVLFIAAIAFGALYQYMGWQLQGEHLVLACILIINYFILSRSQQAQAAARIDALEKRLA